MQIGVIVELTRLGISSEPHGGAARIRCCFHDDNTPSLDVFLDTGKFHCYACKKSGDFATLLAKLEGRPRHIVEADLAARYGDDETPLEAAQIERYHREIWSCEHLLASLRHRMITDEIIRHRRLGRDGDRISIPVAGPSGVWVTIRRYLPDLPPGDNRRKMTNMRGRGSRLRLYPFDQLRFDKIVLFGGEIKALASEPYLNPLGIGSITLTGGEKDWSTALEAFFANKRVWVCNDIDETGVAATRLRCARLMTVTERVDPLYLPLDISAHPHGDVNDYLREHSGEELVALLDETVPYEDELEARIGTSELSEPQEPRDVSLASISDPRVVNQRIRCQIAVSALDQSLYYIPKRVRPVCDRDQTLCAICPVFAAKQQDMDIPAESGAILGMIDSHKSSLAEEIKSALRIPKCPTVELQVLENYKVVEIRAQKSIDLTENDSDKLVVPVVVVNDEVEANETYRIVGKPIPHPKTQVATIVASKAEAVEDALDSYDPGDTSDLAVFRPAEWTLTAVDAKMRELYESYSRNITKIYDRYRLHAMADLVWHSVLGIPIEDEIEKGVLELLVVGDSGQGKTRVTKALGEYYGLGVRMDCKNATVAGILGGLEQIGGKWFVQWGIVPTHDRRLVIFEELKGMRPEVFAKLTEMRSSQVAEIPKICKSKARARCRIIALSNPAKQHVQISAYPYGIRAVSELVPNPEDVRRFDVALVLNKDDISASVPNEMRSKIACEYSREQSRRLVLWAWTREANQIVVPDHVWQLILDTSQELCLRYSDTIPLIDRGSVKHKLLRLATAAAARTFSTTDDGLSLVVRECHVHWIVNLLGEEYESTSNGYYQLSKTLVSKESTLDTELTLRTLRTVIGPAIFCKRLMISTELELQDFCDWCGWSRDESGLFISAMVCANALIRQGRSAYVKSSGLVQLLRELEAKDFSDLDPPNHLQGEQ